MNGEFKIIFDVFVRSVGGTFKRNNRKRFGFSINARNYRAVYNDDYTKHKTTIMGFAMTRILRRFISVNIPFNSISSIRTPCIL